MVEEDEGLKFSSHEEILALPLLWNPRMVCVGKDVKSTSSHGQGHQNYLHWSLTVTCSTPKSLPGTLPGHPRSIIAELPLQQWRFQPELRPEQSPPWLHRKPRAVPGKRESGHSQMEAAAPRVPGLGNALPLAVTAHPISLTHNEPSQAKMCFFINPAAP